MSSQDKGSEELFNEISKSTDFEYDFDDLCGNFPIESLIDSKEAYQYHERNAQELSIDSPDDPFPTSSDIRKESFTSQVSADRNDVSLASSSYPHPSRPLFPPMSSLQHFAPRSNQYIYAPFSVYHSVGQDTSPYHHSVPLSYSHNQCISVGYDTDSPFYTMTSSAARTESNAKRNTNHLDTSSHQQIIRNHRVAYPRAFREAAFFIRQRRYMLSSYQRQEALQKIRSQYNNASNNNSSSTPTVNTNDLSENSSTLQHVSTSSMDSQSPSSTAIPTSSSYMDYPKEFFDALNSCDKNKLYLFMQQKCTKDVSISLQYEGDSSPYGGNYLELIGSQAINYYFASKFTSIPDGYYKIVNCKNIPVSESMLEEDNKLKLRHRIVSVTFTFSGTKTLTLLSDKYNMAIVSHSLQQNTLLMYEIDAESHCIIREIPSTTNMVQEIYTPKIMDLEATCTFYINDEMKLYNLEVLHHEMK